jgi:hypothetical protein
MSAYQFHNLLYLRLENIRIAVFVAHIGVHYNAEMIDPSNEVVSELCLSSGILYARHYY